MKHVPAVLALLFSMCAATGTFAADESAPALLEQARKALDAKDYAKAIDLYQQSQKLLPLNAQIPYNLAVAQYRQGEYDQAAESLKQAMSLTNDADLRARSIYNLGNSAYAQTLKAMAGQADPQQAAEQMKDAQQYLKDAIDNYKKAIDAAPKDQDAKANAELSQRLLTELQKVQQQQQQQQQEQQQNQGEKKDQQQQQQSGAQSQPQSQPDQSQQQQQQQKQEQNQDQKQSDSQQSQDQESKDQQKDQQKQQQQQGEQQKQDQQQPDQDNKNKDQKPQEAQKPEEGKGDKKGMTREAAERLLQAVRDKEKQRRAELARREAARYAPVDKDW